MHWTAIDRSLVRQRFYGLISEDPLTNNRFVGFLGLARPEDVAGRAWILEDDNGSVRLLLVATGEELIPLQHPIFPLTPDVVRAIREQFDATMMITLHAQQIDEWEHALAADSLSSSINLATHLYSVSNSQLQLLPPHPDMQVLRLTRMDALIENYVQTFALETIRRTLSHEKAEQLFARHEFYGLVQGQEIVSITAATRTSIKSRCLSYVFTPAAKRGQGFALRLVGEVARQLLTRSEISRVFLYADAKNPSSNRVYQKLGFRVHSDSRTYTMDVKSDSPRAAKGHRA